MKLSTICKRALATLLITGGLTTFSSLALAQQQATININTASAEAIAEALSGIGTKRANAIVAWRNTHGEFTSLEQLSNIKGVGEKVLDKNRDRITLQ